LGQRGRTKGVISKRSTSKEKGEKSKKKVTGALIADGPGIIGVRVEETSSYFSVEPGTPKGGGEHYWFDGVIPPTGKSTSVRSGVKEVDPYRERNLYGWFFDGEGNPSV